MCRCTEVPVQQGKLGLATVQDLLSGRHSVGEAYFVVGRLVSNRSGFRLLFLVDCPGGSRWFLRPNGPIRALALQCFLAAGEDSEEAPAEQSTADRLHRLASRVSRVRVAGQPVDVRSVGRRSERQCAALVIERRD